MTLAFWFSAPGTASEHDGERNWFAALVRWGPFRRRGPRGGLTSPSDAGIVSREEVTPWLTRYVVEGTSTDLPSDPNVIRISARDIVTLTLTLIPSPLSPNGPASARFYGGCIFIPHPFTPYRPCGDPPAYPAPGSTTTFGPPRLVTDPYVPQVHGYQGLGTAGRLAYDVSPGAAAIIEVGVNAPLPPFFTTEEKETSKPQCRWLHRCWRGDRRMCHLPAMSEAREDPDRRARLVHGLPAPHCQ